MQAEPIHQTIQQMYTSLKEGCIHVRNTTRVDICLACRLEIYGELRRLHLLEDSIDGTFKLR